jgi:hypothetical protein
MGFADYFFLAFNSRTRHTQNLFFGHNSPQKWRLAPKENMNFAGKLRVIVPSADYFYELLVFFFEL